MEQAYDYVIVGAGSAGCVVANRLSENPDVRVLLLEAGGSDRALRVSMPSAFTYAMDHTSFDWGLVAEAEPQLDQRVIHHPRGRVLGGSSSINAMGFTRGHPEDFEGWAGNQLPSWTYAHCLPYFKRMERFSGGADAFRGGDGPLNVTAPGISHPLNRAYVNACVQAGYTASADTNGYQTEGIGAMDQTVHAGRRVNTSRAYLRPVGKRPNLKVLTGCFITRIGFEGKRAVGVDYQKAGAVQRARATREVVLAAGSINTPRLLMLSGVGDADALRNLHIDVIADRPGVGANLQDHIDVQVKTTCTQPVSDTPCLLPHNKVLIGLEWLLFKTGPGATNHFEIGGYIRSRTDLRQPDLMLFFVPLLVKNDGSRLRERHGYQSTAVVLQPKSRGYVKLRTNNPADSPRIFCNYLSEPDDLRRLKDGIDRMRDIFAQKAFDRYRGVEINPGHQDVETYIRATAKSTHHLSCTCPMGYDQQSVVDENGRVHEIEGLRVVDASVMPTIASAALNATVIMVAEKMADSIAGVPRLPPMVEEAEQALTYSRNR